MSRPVLSVRDVRKTVDGNDVLRGIDLSVDRGDIVVLMGENGAGKTLLLCGVCGGLELTGGHVRICGRPASVASADDLVFLHQAGMAIEYLTGRENVAFYGKLHGRTTGRWRVYTEAFELSDALSRRVRDYSGGMRRKLELAMTLGVDVPLYVLDEPSAGLDLSMVRRLHDDLLNKRANGAAVLLSSHAPLDMAIADTVAFLVDGRIAARGAPGDLLESLPPVVRIRGHVGRIGDAVREAMIGDRVFVRGDEARGFRKPSVGLDRIEAALGSRSRDLRVEADSPSFTDLFNYRTKIDTRRDD